MTRFVSISAVILGFALAQNAETQPRYLPGDTTFTPTGLGYTHPGPMSGVGDSEIGTQWNGSDSFMNPFARYFIKPNFAVDLGAEFDLLNFDDSDLDPSHLLVQGGLFYELKDSGSNRCYLRPGAFYQRDVFDQRGDKVTQNDFGGYIGIGGDVRVARNFFLGMEAGARFSTFSSDIEIGGVGPAVEGASGSKLWAGVYNRVNLTYHFSRPRYAPE